ncbi:MULTISPECIES: hypothetical protein [unclassified Streptomyces]|uniref:hypothetical protein n=1 Tax=unclassified Streptomyces TaxID=2593676 RepID=UPI00070DCEA3|nr:MULTISPECIES: hypothetical protein [unclassified Streptomyces]KRC93878.1 hypothetical protein ASE41_38905 [Streptomyces sp. Root264]
MYEYELHQARSAELRRRAADERLARAVARGARAARGAAAERAGGGAESESHTHRPRRLRFPRTA